jgi:hypothetical protein
VAAGALPLLEGDRWLLAGVLGPSVELARRNLERHRRRNTTTALMFILSISLVIFVASLVVLFSRMSMTMVEHFNGADLRLQSDDVGALGLKAELTGAKGVERISEVRLLRSRTERGTAYDVVLGDLVGMKQLWLVPFGVDAELPRVLYTNHIRYADGGPEGLLRVANYQPPRPSGSSKTPPVVFWPGGAVSGCPCRGRRPARVSSRSESTDGPAKSRQFAKHWPASTTSGPRNNAIVRMLLPMSSFVN